MKQTTQTECLRCKKLFLAYNREIKRGNGKYCSKECGWLSNKGQPRTPRIELVCNNPVCEKTFLLTKGQLDRRNKNNKHGLHFCSRNCKDYSQSFRGNVKQIQPKHYGSGLEDSSASGQRRKLENRPCEKCGYSEHLEIIQLHHKDRNRKNNVEDNLEFLCPNCHLYEHFVNKDGLYSMLVKK